MVKTVAKMISLLLLLSSTLIYANSVVLNAQGVTEHGDDYPAYPAPNYGDGSNKDQIDKGEYLVKMGDCIACHTNTIEKGKPFAGGLPFDTPFGTFYSQNITPDKLTGIGNWTDQDFINALRHGISPQGENYFPVFPYVYFNRLSDEDILAIKAYLFSIPAIHQDEPPNKVMWPFRMRILQSGWKLLFFDFHKGQIEMDPSKSDVWNRGRYIVDGLGHCAMCHSPLNVFGASKTSLYLGGTFVNGFYAPNITSATLGDKDINAIVEVFSKGKMLEGGDVEGPMAEVDHDSLRYLTNDDLVAIATYLKTVKPVYFKKKKMTGTASEIGKKLYDSTCATCHASGAAGAPVLGDVEAWKPRIAQGMDVMTKKAITGFGSMPPKGTCMSCTDEQIKDAVQYMADNSQPGSHSNEGPSIIRTAPPTPDTSIKLGKEIYTKSCASCHDTGSNGAPKLGDKTTWAPLIAGGVDNLFIAAARGHTGMPNNRACASCSGTEIEAAVKYMVQQGASSGNYELW